MEEKRLIAKGIIYECTENVDGFIKVDSVQQYLSYIKFMIKHHTNLEYTYEFYDALCSVVYNGDNLLNVIIGCFGEDAKECSRILNLEIGDLVRNNSVDASVVMLLNGIKSMTEGLSKKIEDKIDGIDFDSIIPKNIDSNRLNSFLSKYVD